MAYRVLIVEDDPNEAATLRGHLARYATERDVSFAVNALPSALEFLEKHPSADLVFMDIAMPGINGMEAAATLRTYDDQTPLVFVTTLAQLAVEGYRVDALDFLVKPVSYADFVPRMDRVMRAVRRREGERITLPTADGVRVVPISDLLYVDIERHDLRYHVAGEEAPFTKRGSIKQVYAELGEKGFVKLSASCVANMARVARIRQDSVMMDGGAELWFSRAQRKAALERLANYVGGSI